jgi:hypothetical protein
VEVVGQREAARLPAGRELDEPDGELARLFGVGGDEGQLRAVGREREAAAAEADARTEHHLGRARLLPRRHVPDGDARAERRQPPPVAAEDHPEDAGQADLAARSPADGAQLAPAQHVHQLDGVVRPAEREHAAVRAEGERGDAAEHA